MNEILEKQRTYFASGKTLSYDFRLNALKKLRELLLANEAKILLALKEDLNKCPTEAYMTELGLVLSELNYQIKHLKKNMKKHYVRTPLAQYAGKSYRYARPYGNVFIISPWNYPVLLSLEPLIGAMAAGNTVFLKPSKNSYYTGNMLAELINKNFPEEYLYVFIGDRNVASTLLDEKWDYIFFTGGKYAGKNIYEAASKHLTPVTLELGGKSPVVILDDARIDLAAKRIAFGKFVNAGQTCVAPDYVLLPNSVKEQFVSEMKKYINEFYPDALNNDNYPKIINQKQYQRVLSLLEGEKILCGGNANEDKLKIEPTLVDVESLDSLVMNEEIFGPVLPLITYKNIDEVYSIINLHPTPLAFYVFTEDNHRAEELISRVQFGGGCINDTIIHLATNDLAFGGVGESGMGQYHGKYSFDTFSHYKSIVKKATWIDLPFRYQPFTKKKDKLIKLFLK